MPHPVDDDPPFARGTRRLPPPTLDPDVQEARARALIDAIVEEASEEAEDAGGPIDVQAHELSTYARTLVDKHPRFAAGTGAPGDGVPMVDANLNPSTARIEALSRDELEALVRLLQRKRGLVPSVTFDGVADHELRSQARALRAA